MVNSCPENWILVNRVQLKYKTWDTWNIVDGTVVITCWPDDGWTLRKEADKSNVSEWEKLTYKIYYRNTGWVAWEPWYQLTDIWPESLAYGWDTCNGVCSKEEEDWKYIYTMNESLLSWEWRELILTWMVNNCPEWWMITNKVILKYSANWVDWEIEWYSVVICGDDDGWTVKKEADKTGVNNWDSVTYTISYRNTWSTIWNSYSLEDDWPAQYLTYKSDSCVWSCHSSVNWNTHIYSMDWTLVPWGTWRLILTWEVWSWVCDSINWGIVNTVRLIYSTVVNWQPVTWTITWSVEISCDLSDGRGIKKEANPTHVKSWEKITYTITYRNTWDKAWDPEYTLTDIWPEKVDYKWSTCNGACRETVVRKNKEYKYKVNEKLDGWESKQLILTWIVKECPEWWMITNKVILKYSANWVDWEIEWYSVVICGDDDGWTVKKEADKTGVNNWDSVTYTISYRNTWSTIWNSYSLEDDWPAQYLTYKSDSCVWSCHSSVNWNTHIYSMDWTLVPWGTWRLILTWEVWSWVCDSINWGIVNTVRLIYTTIVNWQPVTWRVTWNVVINCNPNGDKEWWWLNKTGDRSSVNTGDKITYTITYQNTWEHNWDSYTLVDIWPEELSSLNMAWFDDFDSILTLNYPNWLPSWQQRELTLEWTVLECPLNGHIVNEARLTYTVKEWNYTLTGEIPATVSSVTCGWWGWWSWWEVSTYSWCLGLETTISVMTWEKLPFWWRIEWMKWIWSKECTPHGDVKTVEINRETAECTFLLYDWNEYSQAKGVNVYLSKFTIPCFDNEWDELENIFLPFSNIEGWKVDTWNVDFSKVASKRLFNVYDLLTSNVKEATYIDKKPFKNDTYGEYKLVLQEVTYQYCTNDWEREEANINNWACEANFVLTKPYIMQINTAWLPQITLSDYLDKFYDMGGSLIETKIWEKVSSGWVQNLNISNLEWLIDKFKKKYSSLAVSLSEKDIKRDWKPGITKTVLSVKKVPNKLIYFVKWDSFTITWGLTKWNKPFTIFAEGDITVTISWNMSANGMIIAPKWTIEFIDSDCAENWQSVKWIFIAKNFAANKEINDDADRPRCFWWNLVVNWVLIWQNTNSIIQQRRSTVWTEWFTNEKILTGDSLIDLRRNQIFKWATLLLNYNSDLWRLLPPGAEVFTEKLDVFKK